MPEGGDFEGLGLSGVSEQAEVNTEQVREEARKAQAAIKQLQKEEGQAKAQDDKLAKIIVQFLGDPQNTDLFLLISRVVASNISSEIIVAILSLVHQEANEQVAGYLAAGDAQVHESALAIPDKASFRNLPPEQQQAIDAWIKKIDQVSAKKPQRSLESIVKPGPNPEIQPMLIQLTAVILRKYLSQQNIEFDFEDLRDFIQTVYVEIIKNLERLLSTQKHLEGGGNEATTE